MLERHLDSSMELKIKGLKRDNPYRKDFVIAYNEYRRALKRDDKELSDKKQNEIETLWFDMLANINTLPYSER